MDQHIVALGGGGFGGERNDRMHEFLLDLTEESNPRVCFLPTAVGDADSVIALFYKWFAPTSCRRSHVTLFPRDFDDLRPELLNSDLIYVSGGSTANMLAVWRVHGLDVILREAWDKGIVLCGSSAGSLCWFEAGITDSFGPTLAPLFDGLKFLPGSNCPHYDGEVQRRPTYRRCVADGFPPGYAADDNVGLHFVGRSLVETVTTRREATAYRVERSDGDVREIRLDSRFLG